MATLRDQTAPVRQGEELDAEKLERFLRDAIPGLNGDMTVAQFPGGHSNLTYCICFGGREFVLRRPPHGNEVKGAHDMGREYAVLSKLHAVYPYAPRPVAFCEDASILGDRFYAMERIHGAVFRVAKPAGFQPKPGEVRGCCQAFIDGLARLHAIDYGAAGLADLYKGPGYVRRQVEGWAKRWEKAKTEDLLDMARARQWLTERLPEDSDATVIHNDYKFDNLIFDADDITRLVGVLDWEMATIGDPLTDFATTLGGFLPVEDGPGTTVSQCFMAREPGAFTAEDLCQAYAKASGRDLSNLTYYFVFAQFKGAVIIEQIYARYARGLTSDPRFAALHEVTQALAKKAAAAMDSGRVW